MMRQPLLPLQYILIKPAGPDCNLDCQYCFYLEKQGLFPGKTSRRMTRATLDNLIRQVLAESRGEITFAWQGGEPTLMGLTFFQQAVELQARHARGHRITNTLQTNGLLLDPAWAAFLKEHGFLVGLSLDGPQEIHDRFRLDRGGKGSHAGVEEAVRLLLEHEVELNSLSVVHKGSVGAAEEIYDYLTDLGIEHLQFIPCVEPVEFRPLPSAYGAFLIQLFDRWTADIRDGREQVSVRFFDSVFRKVLGLGPGDCTLLADCGNYLVVEHDGSVFSCDFAVEPAHRLGSLSQDRLSDLLNSSAQVTFGSAKSKLPGECRECEWLTLCRGGCPRERFADGNGANLHSLCDGLQIFFSHAVPILDRLAISWQQQQEILARRERTRQWIGSQDLRVGDRDPCPCRSGAPFAECCGSAKVPALIF